jgi:hypothetical protein
LLDQLIFIKIIYSRRHGSPKKSALKRRNLNIKHSLMFKHHQAQFVAQV